MSKIRSTSGRAREYVEQTVFTVHVDDTSAAHDGGFVHSGYAISVRSDLFMCLSVLYLMMLGTFKNKLSHKEED